MAEKVTIMKLTVEACAKCYKKAKKALRKFPQIRDELYDEKTNTIIIKVVCYDPEKLMNKLCNKGGRSIKSIVILEPPKPIPAQTQPSEKPKEPEKVPAPVPVQVPAPTPAQDPVPILVPAPAPVPQLMPMFQAYHFGPYYETQQGGCSWRPVYDNWGGGPHPHCCHEVTYQQSCSIL
ncbi:Heavy metal transport/detoxification superfamily protein [Raphanus sativus]|uniref:Protein PYRICULARIA ORYZAE RESISTANCE 21-like n=1 Tax=Raphanus sativus TaxID=3726 RepID=A0A9W3CCJ3_RAPSA|nr:protein PYRICULARIA ORYZAE RESISTANCE 21-like [Raphanus sativus]KAJ4882138.1 Heavy metal transport/detoxification superfamily protein [Raphanus sativus]